MIFTDYSFRQTTLFVFDEIASERSAGKFLSSRSNGFPLIFVMPFASMLTLVSVAGGM